MKKYIFILLAAGGFSTSSKAQTLEDYLKVAAENNPGVQARYKAFESAVQRVAQSRSLPDPNLSFGYFVSPVETRVGPQRFRFALTQMFPWWGALKARGDAAAAMAEADYQRFLEARNNLFYRVSAAYYPLFELNRLIALEKENVSILSSYKDIANIKFQNGRGAMVDILRVDIIYKDATTNLAILNKKKKPLNTHFNRLLNRHDEEVVYVQDSLSVNNVTADYSKDSLLSSNPLLNELKWKIKAGEAQERAAIKQGMPTFGIGLSYVMVEKRADVDVADNGKDALMPMVSVDIPVFRNKYNAARKEAQLMQESFALQREEMANRLAVSYDMVWFEIQKQVDLIRLYDEQIQESERSLSLLFTAYSHSGKDFEEVLRTQQQVLKYRKMKATALAAHHIAIAKRNYLIAKKQ